MSNRFLQLLLILVLFMQSLVCLAQIKQPLLVDIPWLEEHLKSTSIRIIDARNPSHYNFQHISGAINIPVDQTFSTGNRKDFIGRIKSINEIFNKSGIDNDHGVVIYDDGSFLDAARLFWVFEVFGHKKVSIMDGGYSLWVEKLLPTDDKKVVPEPSIYITTVSPARLATKFWTRLAIDNPFVSIVDARTPLEFLGLVSRANRSGHIPGSVNIPVKQNFSQADGFISLRSDRELASLYGNLKIEQKVITYCNRGKESAATYFVLRKLGYDVSAYDGSWMEWGNDRKLPIMNKN